MSHHDLEDALNFWRTEIELDAFDVVPQERFLVLMDAARLVERLLPGECEHGSTEPHDYADPSFPQAGWHIIHCDGQLWDEGIVEAVAKAMHDVVYDGSLHPDSWEMQTQDHKEDERRQARFVLSALVELLTEKVER